MCISVFYMCTLVSHNAAMGVSGTQQKRPHTVIYLNFLSFNNYQKSIRES